MPHLSRAHPQPTPPPQLHEAVPQTLLPLLPLLREELEVDATRQRAAAVDLVARLLTGHPGGGALVDEYEPLLSGLLQRGCDKEVRRAVWLGAGAGRWGG